MVETLLWMLIALFWILLLFILLSSPSGRQTLALWCVPLVPAVAFYFLLYMKGLT